MAKGKKASGKNYTSKGERPNTKKSVLKAVRRDRTGMEDALNKLQAQKRKKK